jgi:two-component system chemotaxis sensor kinase CheA
MTRDPYKYFRVEARDLVEQLGKGVLDMEKGPPSAELLQRMLRVAHTLKGAARVVKQIEIADLAHKMEDILAPLRDQGDAKVPHKADDLLTLADEINRRLANLGEEKATQAAPSQRDEAEFTLLLPRIDAAEMDALLDGISETAIQVGSMQHLTELSGRAHHLVDLLAEKLAVCLSTSSELRPKGVSIGSDAIGVAEELRSVICGLESGLNTNLDQLDRETHQLRDTAERLRLVPAHALFATLERVARDAAQTIGICVALETHGGDVRLESHVLAVVQVALIQLIRNAVAHGIELETERTARNKPAEGRVRLDVVRLGNRVRFICKDDGHGVDIDAVRRLAKAKGLLSSEAEQHGPAELIQLLLRGGLTTSGAVSQVSGRGIGLDVVREAAERLHGELSVRTEAHLGTTVELDVPVSISSLDALIVTVSNTVAAIPLDGVRYTLLLDSTNLARTPAGETMVYDGNVIPYVPLGRPLNSRLKRANAMPARTVVVIGHGEQLAGIGVDRIVGSSNIVVRPLPALAPAELFIAGAFFDSDGMPQVVVAPEALIRLAQQHGEARPLAEMPARLPILVVDDSLTTRMLEQSILESAGYDVDLAVSAEEALEKAARRRYGIFLVDIEMPGMDGFAFVERTRLDPVLRQVPAVLVSSRSSSEDRQHGHNVGALDFITKGEFDQRHFLKTIERALGGS